MDMGRPVILLNLDDLYESLYDALNQYFSTWGDKKFVDLGLGTHRVKAFVDDRFRYRKSSLYFMCLTIGMAMCLTDWWGWVAYTIFGLQFHGIHWLAYSLLMNRFM